MKRLFTFLGLSGLLASTAFAQGPSLVFGHGIGAQGTDKAYATVAGEAGHVYAVGSYQWDVDFNPGPGSNILSMEGNWDIFITKQDSNGNFIWAKTIGGLYDEAAYALAIDDQSNLYIGGSFNSITDFDPGPGTVSLTPNNNQDEAFILKLDSAGTFVWVKTFSGSNDERIEAVAVGSSNELYVVGTFKGTSDFDPGAGTANLTASGATDDAFIVQLNSSGVYQWAYKIGGTGADMAHAVYAVPFQEVVFAGEFATTVDLDPTAGTQSTTVAGGTDAFVVSLTAAGGFNWAKSFRGTGNEIAMDVHKASLTSTYYVGGYFSGTADFDPGAGTQNLVSAGGNDAFIAKLDASGNFVYADKIGGSTGDDAINSIDLDEGDNLYATGKFKGTANFDPNGAGVNDVSSATESAFVLSWSPSGNYRYHRRFTGTGEQYGLSIDALDSLSFYTVGGFTSTADVGYPFNQGLTSSGQTDFFWTRHFICTNDGPADIPTVFGDTVVCVGASYTYSIDPVPGALSYYWEVPNNWTGSSTTTSLTTLAANFVGSVYVYAYNVCGQSSFGLSIDSVVVPLDTLSLMVGDTLHCPQNSATYSVDPEPNADYFTWSMPSDWTGTSATEELNVTVGFLGGPVSVTATNHCGTTPAQTMVVTVPFIDMNISVVGDTLTVGQAGATYQWVECGSFLLLQGETNQTLIAPDSLGQYYVNVTLGNCSVNSQCIQLPYVGVGAPVMPQVSLYPNPNRGSFKLSSSSNLARVEVMNMTGQMAYAAELSGQQTLDLNLELKAGMYFVRVTDSNNLVATKKLVIE